LTVLSFLDILIFKCPPIFLKQKRSRGVFLKIHRETIFHRLYKTLIGSSPMDSYDHLEIRCPRLGHELSFSYCRREAGDMPCHRAIKCWQVFFPVEAHLREILSAAQWELFLQQSPLDKMTTLIDLIEQARTRVKSKP
jgi:hypothetical protein